MLADTTVSNSVLITVLVVLAIIAVLIWIIRVLSGR